MFNELALLPDVKERIVDPEMWILTRLPRHEVQTPPFFSGPDNVRHRGIMAMYPFTVNFLQRHLV